MRPVWFIQGFGLLVVEFYPFHFDFKQTRPSKPPPHPCSPPPILMPNAFPVMAGTQFVAGKAL